MNLERMLGGSWTERAYSTLHRTENAYSVLHWTARACNPRHVGSASRYWRIRKYLERRLARTA